MILKEFQSLTMFKAQSDQTKATSEQDEVKNSHYQAGIAFVGYRSYKDLDSKTKPLRRARNETMLT